MTLDDLWPLYGTPSCQIGHSSKFPFLRCQILIVFSLTSGDSKWPLTSTKNDRDHLLNLDHMLSMRSLKLTNLKCLQAVSRTHSPTSTHTKWDHQPLGSFCLQQEIKKLLWRKFGLSQELNTWLESLWGLPRHIGPGSSDPTKWSQYLQITTYDDPGVLALWSYPKYGHHMLMLHDKVTFLGSRITGNNTEGHWSQES